MSQAVAYPGLFNGVVEGRSQRRQLTRWYGEVVSSSCKGNLAHFERNRTLLVEGKFDIVMKNIVNKIVFLWKKNNKLTVTNDQLWSCDVCQCTLNSLDLYEWGQRSMRGLQFLTSVVTMWANANRTRVSICARTNSMLAMGPCRLGMEA